MCHGGGDIVNCKVKLQNVIRALKIVVNTRLLLPGKLEGIGWFTYHTFKRIVQSHPEVSFYFVFDRSYSKEFIFADNVKPVVLFPQARHPFLYYLFFEYSLTRFLNQIKADLFVSPDGFLSERYRGLQLPVFHDLNFMHNPDYVPYLTSKYYNYFFPRYAKKAKRIVTVSEYSKQDIAQTFNYPEEHIDVTYNGVHEIFRPVDAEVAERTKQHFAEGSPYFVYIGALHKRKNIDNMLRAFDVFKDSDSGNHKLLIIGALMFGSEDLREVYQAMRHRNDVLFVGRQYDEDLRNIVAASTALLLVSHFEGFGIPIIEAMQCDVPVVTSNCTSMPEVAGDAALLVDPGSVDQIAMAISQMANDEKLRHKLIENGRLQRQKFSWDQTAERMWSSIEKCLR